MIFFPKSQHYSFGINTEKYVKSPPNVTVALAELLKEKNHYNHIVGTNMLNNLLSKVFSI